MEAYIHTYIRDYKYWLKNYYIYIFDLDEKLTISFIPYGKESIIDTLKDLYLKLGVEIEFSILYDNDTTYESNKQIGISDNTKAYLIDNMKVLFDDEDYKKININRLKNKLRTMIDFEKLIKDSNKYSHQISSKSIENFNKNPEQKPVNKIEPEPYDNVFYYQNADINNNEGLQNVCLYENLVNTNTDKRVILFNNIYNISIVLNEDFFNIKPEEFCNIFTEWVYIDSIENNEKYYNDLYDRFNLKTFDSYFAIIEKFTTFLDYNDINVHRVKDNTTISKVDSNVIKKLISSKYKITTNESNKIKSLALIEEVMNLLRTNNYVCAKSSLPVMFLQCGLKKKRYSDGIYYYGLEEIMKC
ncbi:MAG: hypothetical protein EBU66_15570 [Bacteroidetes bacterium]|nr:hypothetical protein [Bacteroidota bacterium]